MSVQNIGKLYYSEYLKEYKTTAVLPGADNIMELPKQKRTKTQKMWAKIRWMLEWGGGHKINGWNNTQSRTCICELNDTIFYRIKMQDMLKQWPCLWLTYFTVSSRESSRTLADILSERLTHSETGASILAWLRITCIGFWIYKNKTVVIKHYFLEEINGNHN